MICKKKGQPYIGMGGGLDFFSFFLSKKKKKKIKKKKNLI